MQIIYIRNFLSNFSKINAVRGEWSSDRAPRLFATSILLIICLPLIYLLILCFQHFGSIFTSSVRHVLSSAIFDTLCLVIGVSIFTSLIGVGLAYLTTFFNFIGIRFLTISSVLPLSIPTYLSAYIYVDIERSSTVILRPSVIPWFWDNFNLLLPDIRSLPGAIFIFSIVLFPYVFISTRIALLGQGSALITVARSLGKTPNEIFFSIILPLCYPAISAGILLVIMETVSDFGASEYLGVRTLGYTIYTTWLIRNDMSSTIQLCLLLILLIFIFSLFLNYIVKRFRTGENRKIYGSVSYFEISFYKRYLLLFFGSCPFIIGFVIPFLYLIDQQMFHLQVQSDLAALLNILGDSILISIFSAFLIVIISIILIYPYRLFSDGLCKLILAGASYGYAVPGIILSVLILGLFGFLDEISNRFFIWVLNIDTNLIFAGTGVSLFFAYVVKFTSVGLSSIREGYDKISVDLDIASRSLGRNRLVSFILVPTWINLPTLIASFFLLFIDIMKELPMTLILRPLGVDTLSTEIYESASLGQFERASLESICLLTISTITVIIFTHRQLGISKP